MPATSTHVEATPKRPRKVSPRSLENAALHYLRRYAATTAQLRRVLARRVDRSVREHGTDLDEALGWVNTLMEKLERNGLINDAAYAEMKASTLRAGGRSARIIAQKLRLKGVPEDVVQEKLGEATAELSEEEAATIWARKKRLGPYRRDPSSRSENRERDLAALARVGFSYSVAKRVLDGASEDER